MCITNLEIGLNKRDKSVRIRDIILFATLIGILTTVLGGYKYGLDNHVEQLPIVLRFLDNSYLPQDFFVNANTDFGPRFYYSKFLAVLGSFIPLPILYLFLTCFSNVLVAIVTYLAARDFFGKSNLTGILAASLVMALQGFHLGGANLIHESYLLPGLRGNGGMIIHQQTSHLRIEFLSRLLLFYLVVSAATSLSKFFHHGSGPPHGLFVYYSL